MKCSNDNDVETDDEELEYAQNRNIQDLEDAIKEEKHQ